MPIPPIDPSTTYTASRVRFTLTPDEFNRLQQEVLPGFKRSLERVDRSIPILSVELAEVTAKADAIKAVFFGIGIYLGGLELEAEGLNGRKVVPVNAADIAAGEKGTGRLFTDPPTPPPGTVEAQGPHRIADLFGGTLAALPSLRPDNELDSINEELPLLALPFPTPVDNATWQAALVKEAAGLTKQSTGLSVIAAAPWLVDVTALQAQIALAQANVVVMQGLDLTTMTAAQKAARTAFITNRRDNEVIPRIAANATLRAAEYEMRFEILDSLLNRAHGIARFKSVLADNIALLTEQRDFFVNFYKIYEAIT
jgi:hypothetical protein